jgi:hypothetical protein
LENRLQNLGYFDAGVVSEVKRKKQKASVHYTVSVRPPYTFSELHPTSGQDSLQRRIDQTLEASQIKPGAPYRLEILRNERERIADILKREGYFFFHPDHILFQADTTVGERSVEVYTTLKADMPLQATQAYRFGHIRVFADYLATDVAGAYTDSIMPRPGLFVFDKQEQFKASALANAIFFRQGELYNIENHDRTLNHLLGLGVFKFVNIRFEESTLDDLPALDVNIMLTPVEKKTLSAELKGVTKSNNFAGPGLDVSFSQPQRPGWSRAAAFFYERGLRSPDRPKPWTRVLNRNRLVGRTYLSAFYYSIQDPSLGTNSFAKDQLFCLDLTTWTEPMHSVCPRFGCNTAIRGTSAFQPTTGFLQWCSIGSILAKSPKT